MSKAKKSYIVLEVDRYAEKIKEFQDYLKDHSVATINDAKTRIQEIQLQATLMEKLGPMLANLDNLREKKANEKELRGGAVKNALMEEDEDEH